MKKVYRITGKFMMGEEWRTFTKEVIAKTKENAKEILLSDMGSKHRVKRRSIELKNIEEITVDQIENPVIKYLVEK